jgi:hypothetical protein
MASSKRLPILAKMKEKEKAGGSMRFLIGLVTALLFIQVSAFADDDRSITSSANLC